MTYNPKRAGAAGILNLIAAFPEGQRKKEEAEKAAALRMSFEQPVMEKVAAGQSVFDAATPEELVAMGLTPESLALLNAQRFGASTPGGQKAGVIPDLPIGQYFGAEAPAVMQAANKARFQQTFQNRMGSIRDVMANPQQVGEGQATQAVKPTLNPIMDAFTSALETGQTEEAGVLGNLLNTMFSAEARSSAKDPLTERLKQLKAVGDVRKYIKEEVSGSPLQLMQASFLARDLATRGDQKEARKLWNDFIDESGSDFALGPDIIDTMVLLRMRSDPSAVRLLGKTIEEIDAIDPEFAKMLRAQSTGILAPFKNPEISLQAAADRLQKLSDLLLLQRQSFVPQAVGGGVQ